MDWIRTSPRKQLRKLNLFGTGYYATAPLEFEGVPEIVGWFMDAAAESGAIEKLAYMGFLVLPAYRFFTLCGSFD